MKRSDIVEVLDLLIEAIGPEIDGLSILNLVEACGMLPPYNDRGLSNYDIAMGNNVNKWEDG